MRASYLAGDPWRCEATDMTKIVVSRDERASCRQLCKDSLARTAYTPCDAIGAMAPGGPRVFWLRRSRLRDRVDASADTSPRTHDSRRQHRDCCVHVWAGPR